MEESDDESTSCANYLISNDLKGYSYEEQFKQLYDLSDHPERKAFLNDLFAFMQKRGTPVNRIPIMAKQVLDLFELYRLVVARGGLVEVINKKIWREITKGLNLPSSITSAAFTLRTQYMKYLYPYECEKENLSTPEELQQAIDGNRREGRRSSYGNYSEMIGSPVGASGCSGGSGGSGEGIPGPSHHQQQLYAQEALCPIALVTNNRNGGGSNDSNNNLLNNNHNNNTSALNLNTSSTTINHNNNNNHNDKSTPVDSMDECESTGEDSMPPQNYSNPIMSFAHAQAEPINLETKNGLNHHPQLPSSSNNHNHQLFFSMTFNDVIYSGILYATRTGKR